MPSNKVLKQKQGVVTDLVAKLGTANSGILVDYRGISVEEDTILRAEMRAANVDYSVVKNTLLNFAIKGTDLEGIAPFLEGPSALAIGVEDPIAPARILNAFIEKKKKLAIKTGFFEGKVISVDEIVRIAKLPSKETLLSQVFGGMKAPISALARVLNQIGEQKASGVVVEKTAEPVVEAVVETVVEPVIEAVVEPTVETVEAVAEPAAE
jgi:large subunit ribosomal protein L10